MSQPTINIQIVVTDDNLTAFNSSPKVARALQSHLQAEAQRILALAFIDMGKTPEQLAEEHRLMLADAAEQGAY